MSDCKRVYRFGTDTQGTCVTEGDKSMNFVLGGKGANLAEMAASDCRCLPAASPSPARPAWSTPAPATSGRGRTRRIVAAHADLEARCGKRLGDAEDPLLVSVRSGAPFSMPGMMDTVLNLGLNDESFRASSSRPKPAFRLG